MSPIPSSHYSIFYQLGEKDLATAFDPKQLSIAPPSENFPV